MPRRCSGARRRRGVDARSEASTRSSSACTSSLLRRHRPTARVGHTLLDRVSRRRPLRRRRSRDRSASCPVWTGLTASTPQARGCGSSTCDSGLLEHASRTRRTAPTTLLFVARPPGTVVLRAHGAPALLQRGSAARRRPPRTRSGAGVVEARRGSRRKAEGGGVVAAAAHERATPDRLDRVAVYLADPPTPRHAARSARLEDASRRLRPAARRAPAAWAGAGRPPTSGSRAIDELQLAVRFALFHLMASVADAARPRSAPAG